MEFVFHISNQIQLLQESEELQMDEDEEDDCV